MEQAALSFTLYFWLLLGNGDMKDGQMYFNSQVNCDKAVIKMVEKFNTYHPDTGKPVFTMVNVYCIPTY